MDGSGVRATTRDPRGHEGRDDPYHGNGEHDRNQNETVRYHLKAPASEGSTARRPNARRMNTGCNGAFYPKAKDRGKNRGNAAQVSGFDTLPSKGGRPKFATLLYLNKA